jgi:hypothetical protein
MKRTVILCAMGITAACASAGASAHADIGVFLGVPGPAYETPPPVVYEAPPVVYQEPPVVYDEPPVVYAPAPAAVYGYGYQGGDWDHRRWHGNGWHKGWKHHHREDDDD